MHVLDGLLDSAYANTDDYKLTPGYIFISGGVIAWWSKKQATIVLSSTEVKYVTLLEASHKVCWLWNPYEELSYKQQQPTLIKGDNNGSIAMAKNPQFHKGSKHIATRWHWIRDLAKNKLPDIESCCDPDQTADILTKALAKLKHIKHTVEIGLKYTWGGVLGCMLYSSHR